MRASLHKGQRWVRWLPAERAARGWARAGSEWDGARLARAAPARKGNPSWVGFRGRKNKPNRAPRKTLTTKAQRTQRLTKKKSREISLCLSFVDLCFFCAFVVSLALSQGPVDVAAHGLHIDVHYQLDVRRLLPPAARVDHGHTPRQLAAGFHVHNHWPGRQGILQ